MGLQRKKLDELISAADRIVAARKKTDVDLFGEDRNTDEVRRIFDFPIQDPDKSYALYYMNIQKFLGEFLPKDEAVSRVIREEICILLAHKERSGLTYGARGSDSRMATSEDMEHIIDVLSEWSDTPVDYFRLANILLNKNKELGYVPLERELKDYMK